MNRKIYVLAAFLMIVAAALISLKIMYGGSRMIGLKRELWRVNFAVHISGKGEPARVKMFLPEDTPSQTIYNEHFDNDGMDFSVREDRSGNRRGRWTSTILEETKRILYTFSARVENRQFTVPDDFTLPKEPVESYPEDVLISMDPSEGMQYEAPLIKSRIKKIAQSRRKNPSAALRDIYDFVSKEIKYTPEVGSKSALATLEAMEADCGGKARLFVALSRAYGFPSRLSGGLILNKGIKHVTHVWAENYINGEWVPFDPSNDHYAFLPDNYLELYKGDHFLIRHKGLSKIGWLFIINPAQLPPVDNPWSLYALPVYLQNSINLLLLIPLGALIVTFLRNMVGINTFGTFAPMLLAIAFRELSLGVGLVIIISVVIMGWLLRKILDSLRILFIPKLSIILSAVVGFMLIIIVVGFHHGQKEIYYATLLPLVIITWIVERFTVSQVEDGTKAAFHTTLGTIVVAVAVYSAMKVHIVQLYLFTFPELILIMIAMMLLMGRYTGLRIAEVWRFRGIIRREGGRADV